MYLGEPRGSDGCNSYLVHLRSEHPSIYLQRGIALERPTKGAAANFRPPRPAWNALQLLLNNWRIMRGVIMRPMIMARTGIIISGELAGFGTKSTGFHSGCSWFIGTGSRLTTPTLTQRAIPLQKSTSVQYHSNTDVQYQSCTAQYQPNRTPSDNTRTTRYNNLMTRRIEKIRLGCLQLMISHVSLVSPGFGSGCSWFIGTVQTHFTTRSDNTRTTRYNNLMTHRLDKIRLGLSTTDDITFYVSPVFRCGGISNSYTRPYLIFDTGIAFDSKVQNW